MSETIKTLRRLDVADRRVNELYRHLTIIEGCAVAVDHDARNAQDSRAKGRLIVRELATVRELIREIVEKPV